MGPEGQPGHPTPGMHIWGWMAPVELEWLGEQAARMDSVVEIGSLHGRSAFALCTACSGPVYCIDPWDDSRDESYASFLSSVGHFPNVRPVRGFSPAAAAEVPDVDMTFIDGAHAYGDVLLDIATWLPKTRKLICGHDFQNADGGYPGVQQAVHAVFGKRRVKAGEGTSIWYVDLSENRNVLKSAPRGPLSYTNEYGRSYDIRVEWP